MDCLAGRRPARFNTSMPSVENNLTHTKTRRSVELEPVKTRWESLQVATAALRVAITYNVGLIRMSDISLRAALACEVDEKAKNVALRNLSIP